MLAVDEHSLKERFDMKYLHQVSYLRDAYGIGVLLNIVGVLSYCCLSGTTCVPVIVQYITTSLLLLSTSYNVS